MFSKENRVAREPVQSGMDHYPERLRPQQRVGVLGALVHSLQRMAQVLRNIVSTQQLSPFTHLAEDNAILAKPVLSTSFNVASARVSVQKTSH